MLGVTGFPRVQNYAKQCLGRVDVKFPTCLDATDVPQVLRRQLFKSPYRYRWNPELAQEQWWIDALTVDPVELLKKLRIIWRRGVPQPVLQSKVHNASVGTMPAVAAYIAVHPRFGTHVFFPYHGAKHGGDNKEDDGKMYEGFVYWHDKLSEDTLEFIKARDYYNRPDAMDKFGKKADRARKLRMLGDFDPKNFLVRARTLTLPPLPFTAAPPCGTSLL